MERFQQGDDKGFTVLYEKYFQSILAYHRRRVPGGDKAEDLTEGTFLKVISKKNKFDPLKGSFATWLYTIATRELIDFFRKALYRVVEIVHGSDGTFIIDDLFAAAASAEDLIEVHECLDTLPPNCRQVVELMFFEERSYREVAQILKIPPGTVASRIHTARRLMKKFFASARGEGVTAMLANREQPVKRLQPHEE